MEKDNLKELFQNLNFDTEEPSDGHEIKFLQKLEQNKKGNRGKGKLIYMNLLAPVAGIAASVLIAFLLFGSAHQTAQAGELASVSPEMKQTQDFYTSVIESELGKLTSEKTPETEAIVNDALKQMEQLEQNHEKLKQDLIESGNDKRVIYAMINNYQQRIELLQAVLKKIDEINNIKNPNYENNII